MIIASPQMDVMSKPIGIAPDDEQHFAVRLQTDHTVDDVCAGFFQTPRPLNIHRFIKSRAKLDNRRDLFPGIRCLNQRPNDGRVAAGAI